MKRLILSLLTVALLPMSTWADGITDKATTIATGTTYCLYNVGAQKFVNINTNWAQAIASETPVPVTLELKNGSEYYLKREGIGQMSGSMTSNYYLRADGNTTRNFSFNGATSGNESYWGFTISEISSGSKTYTISYQVSNVTKYVGFTENVMREYENNDGDNTKWVFITPADFITYYNGDATLLVNNAGCTAADGWTNGKTKASEGDHWTGTSTTVFQPTKGITVSQTINKLPAGNYTVQVVVRGTSGEKCTLQLNEGDTKEVTLKGNANGTVASDGLILSALSSNKGWFLLQSSAAVAADGSLEIKVGNNGSSGSSWWQMCDVKLLKDADTEGKYQTGAATYTDLTSAPHYFYTLNNNALVKASANASNLPNVIVDGTCANLKLTDGAYNFGTTEAFTATSVTYDRAFTASNASTVCLPFALNATETASLGTFYTLDSYSDGKLRFVETTTTEAYKPYLVVPTSTGITISESKSITSTPGNLTSAGTGASFIGTMTRQTGLKSDESNTLYGFSNGSFKKINTTNGVNINPFRAYISIPVSQGAPEMLNIDFGSNTTGIENAVKSEEIKDKGYYDLQGRRIAQPTKGLFIVNSKKVVVK